MAYDVAVVGLGGMGSAILAHSAARGASVIGLEQFHRGHDLGASSGRSRLIRKAYFESPAYVPLLQRAYELWRELEKEASEKILRITGLLSVGDEHSEILKGTLHASQKYNLPLEQLSKRQIMARYPALNLMEGEVGTFEAEAGVLTPERAIEAHLRMAELQGAETRFNAKVESWNPLSDGFEIHLANGAHVSARKLVLTLGPWFKEILEGLGVPLRIQRNVQAWFSPSTPVYEAARFPCFFVQRREWPAPLYGFPDFGDGVKAAFHGHGALTDAKHIDRELSVSSDIEPLAQVLESWMPGAANSLREAKPCMYALTPDEHFVTDRHPEHANLILCGGFSGHGFKFCSVVGEVGADLALDGGTRHEIGFLSLKRFKSGKMDLCDAE